MSALLGSGFVLIEAPRTVDRRRLRRAALYGLGSLLEDVGGLKERGPDWRRVHPRHVAQDLRQLPAKTCDHTVDVLDFDARRDHVLPRREAQRAV